jgi:thiosulfate/3-mercaptopyruvate sulfurtransferase
MSYTTVIACDAAKRHIGAPRWVFVDCRASMADREQGRRDYRQAHVPGAVYAGLDVDLSGPVVPGVTGRHPLPDKEQVVTTINRLGITNDTQVVVYDDQAGQMAAARLWWLLTWAGHAAVALLDGGFRCWQSLGLPTETAEHENPPALFRPAFNDYLAATADDVTGILSDPSYVLVDSRASDRYRGENETIDPVAGHIPGALSLPFQENIAEDGTLKPPSSLRERFMLQIGALPGDRTVFYCGSGVTAAQNVLAYRHSGSPMPRLYVGSWSDWITDPTRPVARGASPRGDVVQPESP